MKVQLHPVTHEELFCSLFASRNGEILIPGLNCHRAPLTAAGLCTDPGELWAHRERLWASHQAPSDGFVAHSGVWDMSLCTFSAVPSSSQPNWCCLVVRLNQGRPTVHEELMKTAGLKSLHCHWQSLLLAIGKASSAAPLQ